MKKDKLSKEAQHLDSKINELAGTTTRQLTKDKSGGDYQLHGSVKRLKTSETKKQKWILINKRGQLRGILDHIAFNTRISAKEWFQRTSDLSGGTIDIDDFYYVLKNEEYELLKELDALDKLDAINMISDLDVN